jgi:hypothetical protein
MPPNSVGLYVEGTYCPEHGTASTGHNHDDQDAHPAQREDICGPDCALEHLTRLLTASAAVTTPAAG